MRKGVLLTNRDVKLLRFLSFGPALRITLLNNIFSKEGANEKTRERLARRRLIKLEQGGLIISKTFCNLKDTIYVLSKDAATIVADRDGKELSHIWIKVNEKQILHDLYVANVARKLVKEEEEKSLVLDYMVPECGLKKGGKLKKGIYYPDLLFAVKGPTQQNRFCFEADCGTISKADFLGKINYFNDTILVVTRTESRLELLLRYLKVERITKLVCLTIFREFMPTALSECTWRTNLSDNLVSLALP